MEREARGTRMRETPAHIGRCAERRGRGIDHRSSDIRTVFSTRRSGGLSMRRALDQQ